MTSSGMKRGLAVSAVTALAVTGLPFLTVSANADSIAEQYGATEVDLRTADGTSPDVVSIRNDGQNTTVHLVAAGGESVAQVRFSYVHEGGDPVVIATVTRTNGVFSTEWAPAAELLGEDVTITAEALGNAGQELESSDSETVAVSANDTSVDISNAPGSSVGAFQQLYAGETETDLLGVISGTTSELTGNVTLDDAGDGDPMTVNAANGGEYGTASGGVRTFKGVADFGTYPWDDTDPMVNQAIVQAIVESDDNEAVSLYKQTITTVTAAAANNNPPAGNPTTTATVTVKDQSGNPIAGAQVVQTDPAGDTKYTDVNGQAKFTVTGDADGNTYTYLVNVDDEEGYQAAKDYQRQVTVTTYSDEAASITGTQSDLGSALDFDEYAAEPVSITVTDDRGNPKNNQAVQYQWSVDPFDPEVANVANAGSGIVTTGTDGKANIPAPTTEVDGVYTLSAFIEGDGTPGQSANDVSMAPLSVRMGEATVEFVDGNVAQAQAGGGRTFDATLELADGTPLPGREITFSYAPGDESGDGADLAGDSFVSATQPAGTTRINNNSAKDVTDGSGTVTVGLTDPSETPQPNELNADLDANTSGAGNAGASGDVEVDWLRSVAPVNADDIIVDVDELFADATPGRPVDLDITVVNADDEELTDYPVTVTVNKGFLSPNAETSDDLTPDPTASEGAEYGWWKSDGTSQTLTTDDAGDTGIVAAIEEDAGFDTASTVTLAVTVTAGGVTKTVNVPFTSANPLNPGEVMVELDDNQTVGVLPKAPTTETVKYNVFTTDQFGNIVAGEPVAVNDAGSSARLNGVEGATSVTSQLKGTSPVLTASSSSPTDQVITGSWTQPTTVWTDGQPLTTGFQEETLGGSDSTASEDETVTDTAAAINWYDIDFANSVYTITHTGADTQPVGETVTVNYRAVDQNGEPIEGLLIRFFRTGPDDLQDGDGNSTDVTDSQGRASYTYQGAKAGTAVVTAIAYRDYDEFFGFGTRIPESEQTDRVTFVNPVVRRKIAAGLTMSNNAKGNDIAFVNAPNAARNALVRLYKVRANGTKVLIRSKRANLAGNARFAVRDWNKRTATRYQARVLGTPRTFADWTPIRRIR